MPLHRSTKTALTASFEGKRENNGQLCLEIPLYILYCMLLFFYPLTSTFNILLSVTFQHYNMDEEH